MRRHGIVKIQCLVGSRHEGDPGPRTTTGARRRASRQTAPPQWVKDNQGSDEWASTTSSTLRGSTPPGTEKCEAASDSAWGACDPPSSFHRLAPVDPTALALSCEAAPVGHQPSTTRPTRRPYPEGSTTTGMGSHGIVKMQRLVGTRISGCLSVAARCQSRPDERSHAAWSSYSQRSSP